MAWFWLAIIGLLIPAYYGVYAYAWGIRNEPAAWPAGESPPAGARPSSSSASASCSPTAEPDGSRRAWPELWKAHSTAGAALGTALNVGDPTLWPRWLLMFGLALGTTAVWVLVDTFWLTAKTTDEAYRQWAIGICTEALHARHALGRGGRQYGTSSARGRPICGNHVPVAAAGVDRRHGGRPRPAVAADDDGRLVLATSVPLWPRLPSASSACWASTPSAGKSCRT